MELRELDHGAPVDLVLLVRGVERRARRGSSDFLRLELADRSQSVTAMVWDDAEEVAAFAVRGAAVRIAGRFEVHDRFGRQIAIKAIESVPLEQVDLTALVEGPSVPVADLERRFAAIVGRIEDVWARELLDQVFARDGAFWARFRLAPAAKHFHEAYPHGLLDHTVRVAEGVEALAPLFGGVDPDVAVTGALLHDIGKAQTYTTDPVAPDLTDIGRLEGHIVIGYEIVQRVLARIDGFPDETARALRHIVLSHHGKQEYGSPVVPQTREAVLVHHVDDLAARMGSFDRLERGLPAGERWSGFDRAVGGPAYFGPTRAGEPPASASAEAAGPALGAVASPLPVPDGISVSAARRSALDTPSSATGQHAA